MRCSAGKWFAKYAKTIFSERGLRTSADYGLRERITDNGITLIDFVTHDTWRVTTHVWHLTRDVRDNFSTARFFQTTKKREKYGATVIDAARFAIDR